MLKAYASYRSRNLQTSHGARRPETSAGDIGKMTTVGSTKTNPFDRTVIFAMSPRTYNQTLKGAPKEFFGAQETDMGTYDRNKAKHSQRTM
jgi:hypothetical protein